MGYQLTYVFDSAELAKLAAIQTTEGGPLLTVPLKGRLAWASLEVKPRWALIEYGFYGVKKDGTPHTRRTTATVHLTTHPTWVGVLFPGEDDSVTRLRLAARYLWPQADGTP